MAKGYSLKDLHALGLEEISPGKYKAKSKKVESQTVQIVEKKIVATEKTDKIFIPYNVISSKRGKQLFITYIKGTAVPRMVDGAATREYRMVTKSAWIAYRDMFLKMLEGKTKPYMIEFTFARSTKSLHWDFHNMVQLPADLMQEHGWIEDDNVANMIPVWAPHFQDQINPGLYIRVL